MKHWTPQATPVRRELCAPDREECTDQTPCDACPSRVTGRCIGCRHPSGSVCGGCGALVTDGWDGR